MTFDFAQSRQHLQDFDFERLFREDLNWSSPTTKRVETIELDAGTYKRRMIAQVAGVAVYEVVAGQVPGETVRQEIYRQTVDLSFENLLIFVDEAKSQSYWHWVKREGKKSVTRHLSYYKGQSGDLILGKLGKLVFELEDFETGDPTVVEAARRLQAALDVEAVTKRFYGDFKQHLEYFVGEIEGIGDEADRRWYASVILNRLMFVYFLQYKGFVDGNEDYLQDKFAQFEGKDFYRDFLGLLFFEGFALPTVRRSAKARAILGEIKYLNGGLFAKHRIEQKYPAIAIGNEAFGKTLELFEKYSWNLDDSPGGKDHEIRPEVLGYIFEKYINQKEFGAYYTRPEITEYLCDRTINKLILDKVNAERRPLPSPLPGGEGTGKKRLDVVVGDGVRLPSPSGRGAGGEGKPFATIEELLFNLDADLCMLLLDEILPKLSLLDPACGSGAFLVAAMKTLINVYAAVIGRIEFIQHPGVTQWLQTIRDEHPSIQYYIKKRIITDNLYGVDIMEEATEITKLRLFLALVASAATLEELEPLPNVDFNIMAGNSLIGLVRVDEDGFNGSAGGMAVDPTQRDLFKPTVAQGNLLEMLAANEYQQILAEKNRSIALFKEQAFANPEDVSTESDIRTEMLKSSIEELNAKSQKKLNKLLFDEFGRLKIKYEQAQATGKATKRLLVQGDIDRLEPFHWGYQFDQIIEGRGGFDAIIANPPWEVFKPQAKEFFAQHNELVTTNKMDIKTFEKEQEKLLRDPEIAKAWFEYRNQFPYVNLYYRTSDEYRNQISIVNGKKAKSTDINLYKLFLERCFSLMKPGGECGIVIPSGIYTDLGCQQLREMLFSQTQVTGLFCFENRKTIFEGVHRSFKFLVLTFEKGRRTESFPAAFMRHEVEELTSFPSNDDVQINVDLIRRLSPDSLSIMEFKGKIDIQIAEKMLQFPLLGEKISDSWNLTLGREFHMTDDRHLFHRKKTDNCLPLYEGKMIEQFTHVFSEPQYWIDESKGRSAILGKIKDNNQPLDYKKYRFGFRKIASSTNYRTLIASVIPKSFHSESFQSISQYLPNGKFDEEFDNAVGLYIVAMWNSFVLDYAVRFRVSANISFFYIYQLPVPRLTKADRAFQPIVDRAAKLICTTPEFDDLAAEVGLGSHANGVTDEIARAKLRAELDGLIAHLYHLTEVEFAHILSTFPIVPESTKIMALNAYRDVERGLIP